MVQTNDQRRGTLQFIGVACLLVFALFLVLCALLAWEQIHVLRSWPVRQALVTRSELAAEPAGRHEQRYSAHIEIAYVVDGQPVSTELISFQSANYQQTVQRAAEFSVGSRHVIRYDPQHPRQVLVDASWNRRFFAVPLITLACGAVFALLAIALFTAARWSGAPRAAAQPSGAS